MLYYNLCTVLYLDSLFNYLLHTNTNRYYSGSSSSRIWLTNVGCTSSDVFLANCSHRGFGNTLSCSHSEDVAVTCSTGETEFCSMTLSNVIIVIHGVS